MPRSRYAFADEELPHFLTFTVNDWIPVFQSPDMAQIFLDALADLRNRGVKLHAFVLMENHAHCILRGENLSAQVRLFKGKTARMCLNRLQTNRGGRETLRRLNLFRLAERRANAYQFWRAGSHPQLIQDARMMRQKIAYIHDNPVRRGYVERAEHWRYSSAANYAQTGGIMEADIDWQ